MSCAEWYSTTNSGVYRKLHKKRHADCPRCPWHDGENSGHKPRRGAHKPKSKNHRR